MVRNKKKFDILFLCHEKDMESLKESIKYAQKNVVGYRKIFLLSKKNFLPDEDIVFVDEKLFPFSKSDIAKYASEERVGWYYQQFLKLYFLKVIGNKSLDNVLVIDADTIFLKKTNFFEGGVPLYNIEIGKHDPYYSIVKRVFDIDFPVLSYSGVTHHMLFQRKYIMEILKLRSKDNDLEFWEKVMTNIDKNTESGFSEYILYFNYMLKFNKNKIRIRKIKFIDFPYYSKKWLCFFKFWGYSYLSAHDYLRKESFPIMSSILYNLLKIFGIRVFVKDSLIKLGIVKVR